MRIGRLRIPPVVLTLIAAAAMWTLARLTPRLHTDIPVRSILVGGFAVAGLALVFPAAASFVHARTTVNPLQPDRASTLVTSGPFRFTRNPMYLGLLFLLGGWAAYLANPLAVIVLVGFVLDLNRNQIPAEEAALTRRFGDAYLAYQRRVRRWL